MFSPLLSHFEHFEALHTAQSLGQLGLTSSRVQDTCKQAEAGYTPLVTTNAAPVAL